jgi:hypothetical protein
MGPASFLKFTTSVAHYIVDDDGDHVLMRMTIQGTWSSASQNQDDRLASGLTERQTDYHYRAQIPQHVVIDAMDEYQNIDQHQVDRCSRTGRRCHTQAASVFGCKISKGRGTAAWWTQSML